MTHVRIALVATAVALAISTVSAAPIENAAALAAALHAEASGEYVTTIKVWDHWWGAGFRSAAEAIAGCEAVRLTLCSRDAVVATAPDDLCTSGWTSDAGRGWFANAGESRPGCGAPGQWNDWAHPNGQGSAHCCSVAAAGHGEPSDRPLPPMGLVVPLYVYPTPEAIRGVYQTVADAAAQQLDVTVIINPGNGDEAFCDGASIRSPDWAAAVSTLRKAGGSHLKTIGYVYTNYTARALLEVEAVAGAYFQCWGVDGIFMDEVSTLSEDLEYYRTLHGFVKARGGAEAAVWLNPGTWVRDERYMDVSDVIMQFEAPVAVVGAGGEIRFPTTPPGDAPAYLKEYPAERTAIVALDVADNDVMERVVNEAAARGAGWVNVLQIGTQYHSNALSPLWPDLIELLVLRQEHAQRGV